MKADLNSLKRELSRLADVDYLKKELNRIRKEVKNFDIQAHLTPQARQRVSKLEKRWKVLLVRLAELQKQVDLNLEKFKRVVKQKAGAQASATVKRSGARKKRRAARKTARKTKATRKKA